MAVVRRVLAAALVTLVGAATLAAQQQNKAVLFQVFGGGAQHLRNLNTSATSEGIADFKTGLNVGASIGVEFNKYFAVHGDLTYTVNEARGASSFAGSNIDRLFYGAHAEVSYPGSEGFMPFAFLGGGGVTVRQAISTPILPTFTKPAGMFGAGLRYQVAQSPVQLIFEGKSLVYKWDRGGFSRTQWDVSYSLGIAYRLGL
jgi:opacity protein-like surface antigen